MHGLIFLMSIVTGQIKKKKMAKIYYCFRPITITMFGLGTYLVVVILGRMKKCEWKIWEKIIGNDAWLGGGGGWRKLVGSGCFLSKPIKTLSPNKMRVKMRSKSSSAFWMKLPIDFEQIFIYFFLFSIFTQELYVW